jgi:hypothetical protein
MHKIRRSINLTELGRHFDGIVGMSLTDPQY